MKDGSLPYEYVDEDEGQTKKRKKSAVKKNGPLPYEYIEDDEVKTKKSARKTSASKELPYEYVDEDEERPGKKKARKKQSASEDQDRHVFTKTE